MATLRQLWLYYTLVLSMLTHRLLAQDSHGLAACQGQCITNVLQLANTYGCTPSDVLCLCNSDGFLPGVYDCSNKSCPAGTSNSSIISYESSICAAATSASRASAASSSSSVFSVTLIPSLSSTHSSNSAAPLTTSTAAGGATVTIYTAAPSTNSSSSSSSSAASSTFVASGSGDSSSSSSSNSGGLSTEAKAGIAIGVCLVALAAISAFAYFWIRHRRGKPLERRPEWTREEIHRHSAFGGDAARGGGGFAFGSDRSDDGGGEKGAAFPDMAESQRGYTHSEQVYAGGMEPPPVPEKSRARGFSGSSFDNAGQSGFGAGPVLGRHPSEKDGERYVSERYSWSTDPRSEGTGAGSGNGNGIANANVAQNVKSYATPSVYSNGTPSVTSNGAGNMISKVNSNVSSNARSSVVSPNPNVNWVGSMWSPVRIGGGKKERKSDGTGRPISRVGSPVSEGSMSPVRIGSPTIGGPEYKTLKQGRSPSFTADV